MDYDFDSQQASVARQRALADMLRRQGMSAQQPQGQMVGGQFIAPSIFQRLNPVLQQGMGSYYDQETSKSEAGLASQAGQAAKEWQSSLPQTIAAQTGTPFQGRGMLMESQDTPEQPVTTGQVLRHTLAGMRIPGNERAADVYNRGALADLAREDTQKARKEDLAAAHAAKLSAQQEKAQSDLDELNRRLEDRALDRTSREQMARDQRALTAQIAQGNLEIRRLAAEAKRDATAATTRATTEGEKSSAGYLNRMNQAETLLQTIGTKGDQGLMEKAVGGLPMVGKALQPFVLDKSQQKLLQAQRDWVRAKLRKESGAVIGEEEMAEEIRTYFPQPGEDKTVADQKAAARQAAARQLEIGAGRELPNANMGTRGGASGSFGDALTPAEAAELAALKARVGGAKR